jgi:hypothetical protein
MISQPADLALGTRCVNTYVKREHCDLGGGELRLRTGGLLAHIHPSPGYVGIPYI